MGSLSISPLLSVGGHFANVRRLRHLSVSLVGCTLIKCVRRKCVSCHLSTTPYVKEREPQCGTFPIFNVRRQSNWERYKGNVPKFCFQIFCEKLFIKKIFPLWGKSRLNTLGRRGGILCARVITRSSVMWAGVWTRYTIRPHAPSTKRTIGCPCYRPHTPIVDTPGRTWSPIDAGSSDTHALYMGTHDT